jgi:hypothetical protein
MASTTFATVFLAAAFLGAVLLSSSQASARPVVTVLNRAIDPSQIVVNTSCTCVCPKDCDKCYADGGENVQYFYNDCNPVQIVIAHRSLIIDIPVASPAECPIKTLVQPQPEDANDIMGHFPVIIETTDSYNYGSVNMGKTFKCKFTSQCGGKTKVDEVNARVYAISIAASQVICYAPFFSQAGDVDVVFSEYTADGKGVLEYFKTKVAVAWGNPPVKISSYTLRNDDSNCVDFSLSLDTKFFANDELLVAPESVKISLYWYNRNGDKIEYLHDVADNIVATSSLLSSSYCGFGGDKTGEELADTFFMFAVSPSTLECKAHPFKDVAAAFSAFIYTGELTDVVTPAIKTGTCKAWNNFNVPARAGPACPQTLGEAARMADVFAQETASSYDTYMTQLAMSSASITSFVSIQSTCSFSGQQCFYNGKTNSATLLVGQGQNGGTVDAFASRHGYPIKHYIHDEIPWFFCSCNVNGADCARYYSVRASEPDTCSTNVPC